MNLKLDWCSHVAAKYACENWHYSKTTPSTMQKLFKVGIWEEGAFVGVIIFGHGANPQIGSPYGLDIYHVCELTRVAIRDGHKNPVSRYLSIAIKNFLAAQFKDMQLIISYADSSQNHHGGIYQATNWIYVGVSKGVDTIFFKGRNWHAKAFRTSHPDISMLDKRVKRVKSGDKHKYIYPLNIEIRKKIELLKKPYPKRAGSKDNVVPVHHTGEGGATPTPALQIQQEIPNV